MTNVKTIEHTTEGRVAGPQDDVINHPLFKYLRGIRSVMVNGETRRLTKTEARVLDVLEENCNRILSPSELAEKALGSGYSDYQIGSCIMTLRRKIEPEPRIPKSIISRVSGYYLYDPIRLTSDSGLNSPRVYQHPAFRFYMDLNMLMMKGQEIFLSPLESSLLRALAYNPNRFLTTDLLAEVWPNGYSSEELKLYIGYLRRKIEPGRRAEDYQYLVSKRGFGYKLIDPSKLELPVSLDQL